MPTEAMARKRRKIARRVRQPFGANMMLNRHRPPRGKTWRDYVVSHLRLAGSIEHALMVQYLFAAYSLDPETGENKEERLKIAGWQNLLLSVAKEEMGHLLTVQNLLCLFGAPAELVRYYQFPEHFHPFKFKLEPLTIESLTRYTKAEGPGDEVLNNLFVSNDGFAPEFQYLVEDLRSLPPPPPGTRHVGDLYLDIIHIVADPARIPDSAFREDSFRYQASWDDWGRGYNMKPARQGSNDIEALKKSIDEFREHPRRADVVVERMATRAQAKAALIRIFEQGEAPPTLFIGSHFQRFSTIQMDFRRIKREKAKANWQPTHRVVENPHTQPRGELRSRITWPRSKKWANLFDLRYHMLLRYLGHTFMLARDGSEARLRGAVIHRAFSEMYNLKAIAGILVRLPLKHPDDPRRAGPPFSIPPSLALPTKAITRWRRHGDLVRQALDLTAALLRGKGIPERELAYLRTLQSLDKETATWIKQIIVGLSLEMSLAS